MSIANTESTKEVAFVDDVVEQRRLLWKIDLRIMPLVMLFYLCSFLDRINIGTVIIFLCYDGPVEAGVYELRSNVLFLNFV